MTIKNFFMKINFLDKTKKSLSDIEIRFRKFDYF